MKKNILSYLLLTPSIALADLAPLDESEMEQVSGKGISIDARIDFAQDTGYGYGDDWSSPTTSSRDDNWIAYRRILVDGNGNVLTDSDGDGYINLANSGANVQKKDAHNGYNVVYENPREDGGDYLIRKPYYVILGEISGGISFEGLQLDFVDKIVLSDDVELGQDHIDAMAHKPALKWTMPSKIEFHDFEIDGLYISEDKYIDKPGYDVNGNFYGDNKILGLRIDGPVYLPSQTTAHVFITSD
jgi:hypothetical protein